MTSLLAAFLGLSIQIQCIPYPDHVPAYERLYTQVGTNPTDQVHFLRSLQSNYFGNSYTNDSPAVFCTAEDPLTSPLYWNKIVDQVRFLRDLKSGIDPTLETAAFWDDLLSKLIDGYADASIVALLSTQEAIFNVDFFVTLISTATLHTKRGWLVQQAIQKYREWATGVAIEQKLRHYELLSKLAQAFADPALNGEFEYLTRQIQSALSE